MTDAHGWRPVLTDEWGIEFHGEAETATGHVWWYTDEHGQRRPLLPVEPQP